MKKQDFLRICDSALYGQNIDGGILLLEVSVKRDPSQKFGGNFGIYLSGWFRAMSDRFIESVIDQNSSIGCLTARNRCEAKLPKYEKWLEEWKSTHPPQTYDICYDCNGPLPNCWCC